MRIYSLCVAILIATVSCGTQKKETKNQQVFHLNIADDPVSLDPRTVRSLKDLTIVKQLYEGLMRLDEEGVPQPAVAESVTISDDFLTYTFHLRPTVWNNQEGVTAFDFVSSWKQVVDPKFASDYSYMLYPIKNAQLAREGNLQLTH